MNIIYAEAKDRFTETAFSSLIIDNIARSIYTIYTCPACGQEILFKQINFREDSSSSSLSQDHSSAILMEAIAKNLDQKGYLDWYCPKCHIAARVYFSQWYGGRLGDDGVDLIGVFEIIS